MTKIRPEQQVEIWAERPDVFELEPKHIRARFAAQVEAKRKKLNAAAEPKPKPEPAVEKPEPRATKPAKKAESKGE